MNMPRKILAAALVFSASLGLAASAHAIDVHQPEVAQFISQMVQKHGFERGKLTRLLAQTPLDPKVIKRMKAPAEALPWYRYRAIFVTAERIKAGRAFIRQRKRVLASAEKKYGVPASVVAAIVGMESHFGEHEGSYSALSALATLAFDYPSRARFFRRELAQYLLLSRKNGFDPRALKSSYAGALGAAQFMPSSYLAYALDADGGGSNLFASWPDIVSSVANYLARHGWKAGQPVVARARLKPDANVTHFVGNKVAARKLREAGVVFGADVNNNTPVRLVKVKTQEDGPQYWVGLPNFLVIMRYNHSPLYALAAAQLASAMARAPATHESAVAAGQP